MNARAEAVTAAGGEVAEPVPQHIEPRHALHIGPAALEEAVYWAATTAQAARDAALYETDEESTAAEVAREAKLMARARTYAAVSMAHTALARAASHAAMLVQFGKCSDEEAADWDMILNRPA